MEENTLHPGNQKNQYHLAWLLPMLYRPRRTLETILMEQKPKWLTPMLGLSLLGILEVLVAGPIRRTAIQMGANLPPDFQYYTPEQQQQFMNAQASQSSALFIYILPILGALAVIWISWFLLKSILHLSLTLSGSRSKSILTTNLTAWASVPLMLRSVVRIAAMLVSHSLISAKGLSGLVTATNGMGMFLSALLSMIDLYFIWQVALILVGSELISGMNRRKTWLAVLAAVLILLLIMALPGFISARMSGLSISRMFFF